MAEKPNVQAKAEKPVIGKKLELRKKQGTITLVTPPSFFTNQNRSFVLVNLSKKDKDNFLLIVADLTIGKGPFKDTYKSDVKYNKKEDSIFVTNLDGPLKHLENTWHFKEKNNVTEISFEVDFELKNEFLNIVMTKSFQFALDKIAEAFQKRAEDLFKKTQN